MNLRNLASDIHQRAFLATLIIALLCLQSALISLPAGFAQYGTTASSDYPIALAYPFKLAVNQTAYLAPADLVFRFVGVTEDSRCPSDVQCIWAGQVSILIDYAATSTVENLGNFSLTLSGGFYDVQRIEDYVIRLAKVEPYPVSTQPKHLSDYVATLVVLKADSNNTSKFLTASSPVALDASDERLETLVVGGQVKVSSSVHNGFEEEQYFVSILEARSQDGVTRFLGWNNVTIHPKAGLDVGLSWTPEHAGNYELRTFLIGTFEEPQILSPVMTSSIEVHAANMSSDSEPSHRDAAVIAGNNQFALDFFSKLIEDGEDGNIFYSPWSISTAFALVFEGAREKTAEEIGSVFDFPRDENERTSSFSSIQDDLNNKNQGNYTLTTANALWVKEGYELSDDYVGVAEEAYDSEVSNVDFTRDESRVQINEWVESKTSEKIKDLIPRGILDELTRLVITNAIYFKGTWVTQFDEKNTIEEDFRLSDSITVSVPMMKLEQEYFKYAETDSLQIIQLPYNGEKVSMLILLPKNDADISKVQQSLTLNNLSNWKESLRNQTVTLHMPKFKLETAYMLNDLLSEMGMPSAFDPGFADFSGITDTEKLYIEAALHKAFVEVNEEGTEAAAATAVVITTESFQPIPLFLADHPFIFIIQENETGNILFLGRVTNPKGDQ